MPSVQATITEQQFTNSVLQYAKAYGWRRFHVRMSGVGGVNVQGDRGFPDLVLVRPPRMIVAELKVGRNKTTKEQDGWLQALEESSCAEIYWWTPDQWQRILETLSRKDNLTP
jgi:hypothetical protein